MRQSRQHEVHALVVARPEIEDIERREVLAQRRLVLRQSSENHLAPRGQHVPDAQQRYRIASCHQGQVEQVARRERGGPVHDLLGDDCGRALYRDLAASDMWLRHWLTVSGCFAVSPLLFGVRTVVSSIRIW